MPGEGGSELEGASSPPPAGKPAVSSRKEAKKEDGRFLPGKPWLENLLQAVYDSGMVAKKANYQALAIASNAGQELTTTEASVLTGYTRDHIGLLIRRGLLRGRKLGRDWLVDSRVLNDYVKKKPTPGRKSA